MDRRSTAGRLAFFAFALLLAACSSGSRARSPADAGPEQAPDTSPAGTDDTSPDLASPSAPDVGPELATSPADAHDLPSDKAPDARDVAVAETAASLPEASPETAREVGADATDAPDAAACASALSGSSPFGKALSGAATFAPIYGTAAPMTATMTVFIYFPAGRAAGAPVQLATQSRVVSGQYFFGPQVVLASDLSAKGLTVGGHDVQITGDLLPGAGGLQAVVGANFSSPGTDVADDRTAPMLMCPTGDVPLPGLSLVSAPLSPLATMGLNATAPLTADALAALRITSPLGTVAFTASAETSSRYAHGPNFTIAAASAFPPSQPLTFDTSAVKDVLGRAVPVTVTGIPALTTTAVLTDLTFAAAPPAGAVACTGCSVTAVPSADGGASGISACTGGGTVSGGALRVVPGVLGSSRSVDAVLALPATSATKLRVRMAVGDVSDGGTMCSSNGRYASIRTGVLAAVGPNGEASTPQNLACDGTMSDHLVDLPQASPLWLVVHLEGAAPMPYMSPVPDPPSLTIDELQFM